LSSGNCFIRIYINWDWTGTVLLKLLIYSSLNGNQLCWYDILEVFQFISMYRRLQFEQHCSTESIILSD
jgi:hypothetical protein